MKSSYTEDQTFNNQNFKDHHPPEGEYRNCQFIQCDLSDLDLSSCRFYACTFTECNLSMAVLVDTAFREVKFVGCKLLGLAFDQCHSSGLAMKFDSCLLNHATFYKQDIRKTIFRQSQLHEVDFSECNLSEAVFDECDLMHAIFDHTQLEKADFRTAKNYTIDPERNRIRKARFSLYGLAGLLTQYDISIEMP